MSAKFIFLLIVFVSILFTCEAQSGEWTWLRGDTISANGNFGLQGLSSAFNDPPPLYEPCEWTDLNGNFWLFGGLKGSNVYSDLWKYTPVSNEWTWMKGPGIPNDTVGNFGILGVPSTSNQPPCLSYGIQSWTDTLGNLWMFGGTSTGSSNKQYNTLWKYEIASNTWTWINGSSLPNQPAFYGTKGVPHIDNSPPPSVENTISWISDSGDLYKLENKSSALWKYDISTNLWTWVKGDSTLNNTTVLGTKGVEDSLNNIGGYWMYSRWKGNDGYFWTYDRYGFMWRYNVQSNNWTWMHGDTVQFAPFSCDGYYGIQCIPSDQNYPCGRQEGRAVWKDHHGNLWLYGGWKYSAGGMRDLWMYNVMTNQWVWANGDSLPTSMPDANYGTMGIASSMNQPGFRSGAIGWTSNSGELFLYGGTQWGYPNNALWKYTIDTICITLGHDELSEIERKLQIFPNPTTGEINVKINHENVRIINYSIKNLLGVTIIAKSAHELKDALLITIDISHLSNGIYFLEIYTNEHRIIRKISKK